MLTSDAEVATIIRLSLSLSTAVSEDAMTPATENEKEEDDHITALKRYRMVDARLRRLCEHKTSGKCNVPTAIHEAWKRGGASRDELRVWLEKYDLDKELHPHVHI